MGVEHKQQPLKKEELEPQIMQAKGALEKCESYKSPSDEGKRTVSTEKGQVGAPSVVDAFRLSALEDLAAFPMPELARPQVQVREPGAYAVASPNPFRTQPTRTSPVPNPTGGADPEQVPTLTALLVADPPSDFENCQVCMMACDSGQGWEACKDQCVPGATFSCHNDTLGSMTTVQEYADFIALFGQACPNASWTTHNALWDGTTCTAVFHCTYHVTHTQSVPGVGPEQPTLKSSDANYCYIMTTDPDREGKITHIQKLWNDTWLLRDLGWIPDPTKEEADEEPTKQQKEDCHDGKTNGAGMEQSLEASSSFTEITE